MFLTEPYTYQPSTRLGRSTYILARVYFEYYAFSNGILVQGENIKHSD